MNNSIRKVAAALAVLMLALFVNLNWVQVVKGSSYRDNPQNQRVLLNEYARPRGDITVSGTAVAHSKATNDTLKYLRVYPQGPIYAPVTGFYSLNATPSPYLGTSGIETAENSVLSGDDPKLFGTRLTDLLTGRNPRGGSVELTMDKATQNAAYQGLIQSSNGQPRRGAVVALDPRTGGVLAAVSTPSYNPSQLSLHDTGKIAKNYQRLSNNPSQPLLNRAFNQLYPPGSTFKVVMSAAALQAGIKPDDQLLAPNGYFPESGRTVSSCGNDHINCIENFDGEQCDNGKTASLAFALAKSCNTTFAALAVEQLGGAKVAQQARLFGFDPPYSDPNHPPNFCGSPRLLIPLPVCNSTPGARVDLSAKGYLARTAFGQQDVRMTPLQGAMIASAVANDGTLMQPYLVARELAPNLDVIRETQPAQIDQAVNPALDQQLQQMMEGVVTAPEGTGHSAAIPNVVVGGKTGTADTGRTLKNGQPEPPDAWFIGYAMDKGVPKIAVAVIIENGGVQGNETTGGEAAAPIAKAVMEAYLKGHPG
ncbi:MAG TPA: penicillin-binding protein 2 [Jatrophihabitans sp.]|jgi:peptidoglycan glycosyltransferase